MLKLELKQFRIMLGTSSCLLMKNNFLLTRSLSSLSSLNSKSYWMPFTDNIKFKNNPRKVFERASGVYYYLDDNTEIFDGISGLWCCNAGIII